MTVPPAARGSALKEWAVVVKALERGTQILILRKGGIREDGFSTERESYFFYPTGFHQTGEKLKPEHLGFLREVQSDPPAEGVIRVSSFGVTAEVFSVSTREQLSALSGEYIYTVDEMLKRYEFRPGEAVTAMAVRVYKLPRVTEIPFKTKYGGCVSWIQLEDSIPAEGAAAALTDGQFNARLEHIRRILR